MSQSETDCLTCKFCATAVSIDGILPPSDMKYFCVTKKIHLVSRFFGKILATGIKDAATCPDFDPIEENKD